MSLASDTFEVSPLEGTFRMDAKIQAWIDQQNAELTATIRRHGWSIQFVGGGACAAPGCGCSTEDDIPFAYTIGLFGLGHPELLILGVGPETAAGVLNELGERIRSGDSLMANQMVRLDDWPHRIIPEPVPNPGEIVLGANGFYQRPPEASVPVFQLTYDDVNGRFPWDEGCLAPELQPRPGTFRA